MGRLKEGINIIDAYGGPRTELDPSQRFHSFYSQSTSGKSVVFLSKSVLNTHVGQVACKAAAV